MLFLSAFRSNLLIQLLPSLVNELSSVATNARDQGRTPVSFGPTDLVCWRTLQGHIGKVINSTALLLKSLSCFSVIIGVYCQRLWLLLLICVIADYFVLCVCGVI